MRPVRVALDDRLLAVLPAQSLYAVGGRVRDELRGLSAPPEDLDYVVTDLALDGLVARLKPLGRVDVVGASFSVVKIATPEGDADVALPRRERSTGSGHREFVVESGPNIPLEDDLRRRDFRMNAIARRIQDDRIIDPYGGREDIAARRIDILAPDTFLEDPLRMLRAAQFAARFRYALSPAAIEGMRAAAPLAATISAERIGAEFLKLLRAERPSLGFALLAETNVLLEIWPELLEGDGIVQNQWHRFDVLRHNFATLDAAAPADVVVRLAALLHDVAKPRTKDGPHFYRHEIIGEDLTREMLERVRFPNETIDAVARLVRHHMYVADPQLSPAAVRRFIRRVGPSLLERLFALRAADVVGSGLPKRDDSNERFQQRVRATLAEAPPFAITDLAVGGEDVIEIMRTSGLVSAEYGGDERVGEALRWLFEQVTEEPDRNERSRLRALLESYFAPGGSRT